MKKISFTILICLMILTVNAQYDASKFRVTFKDKNNTPYSISQPEQFLSQKALDRRSRQNIAIKSNDLPVNSWYIDSVRNTGAVVYTISKWFNCVTISTLDSTVIAKILALPFVSGIDTLAETSAKKGVKLQDRHKAIDGTNSYKGSVKAQELSANFSEKKGFDYGPSLTQAQMIGMDYMHERGFRGQGITIAILDAGFYKVDSIHVFDSLWMNNQIMGTKDFVQPGGNVFIRSTHGMMVLSIMGGNVPGSIIGTAPKANFWLLRSEDADTEYPVEEDNWVSAAEFADSVGADVINSSLGYTQFFNPKWDHTYADLNGKTCRASQGAALASSKGIIVVNSAGNSGASDWHYIGAPADADSILSIGAVDSKRVLASFSSRGPTVDGRVKPSVCAMGFGTYVSTTTGSVMPGNGTSFSSPVMAGSVACLLQANSTKTNMQIINAVIASASKFFSPDADYGYGIPNFPAANLILSGNRIYNFDNEKSINIFPNPFQDYFSIMFYSNDTAALDVNIYEISGKLAYSKENITKNSGCNYIMITGLGNLRKGNYLLKVVSGKNIYTTKIIKTK